MSLAASSNVSKTICGVSLLVRFPLYSCALCVRFPVDGYNCLLCFRIERHSTMSSWNMLRHVYTNSSSSTYREYLCHHTNSRAANTRPCGSVRPSCPESVVGRAVPVGTAGNDRCRQTLGPSKRSCRTVSVWDASVCNFATE